jgi:Caspase domain
VLDRTLRADQGSGEAVTPTLVPSLELAATGLRRWLISASLAIVVLYAQSASAAVTRVALVIGNDRGLPGQAQLAYAERDAERVYQVLRDLGGFAPANMVLLQGSQAATVEATLVTLNERIRGILEAPTAQVLLFVYYSGHSDGEALGLDGTRLDIVRFAQLVRGSASTFRVLVVDACRSGALTRRKGGRIAEPFPLETEPALPGQGMAFLTASAAHEDAQESDAIGGSFFTHALVSGLLGAADANGDGAVGLEEAYGYSYDATLRATSRSLAGVQHPTFRYDLRGQGRLVLTRPSELGRGRGQIELPPGQSFLITRDDARGVVVGEVGAHDKARIINVREGRYYLVGRNDEYLVEGPIDVQDSKRLRVDEASLQRVEYAQLARKGGNVRPSHGASAGYWVRTPLPNSRTICQGPFATYSLDSREFSLRARVSACRAGIDNTALEGTLDELNGELMVLRARDFGRLSAGLGVGASAGLFWQRFETRRVAPASSSAQAALLIAAELELALGHGYFARISGGASSYFFRLRDDANGAAWNAPFAVRSGLELGKRF